jgi:hypothetical protein
MTGANSEKYDKRMAQRRLRHLTKRVLGQLADPDDFHPPLLREVSDVWVFAKDGKCWYDFDNLAPWIKPWQVRRK